MSTCYILGAGLTGLTVAEKIKSRYSKTIIIEKNNFIGGLCQTHEVEGINYEFGPHVLYAKSEEQKKFWNKYLTNKLIDYRVRCSIDGKLGTYSELFDFPISYTNLSRLGVEYTPQTADYSNFESYMISQIGPVAYNSFVKNYNIKQWGINPSEMSAEWARFRPLTLKEDNPKMFGDLWAGHPGSYRDLFSSLGKGLLIKTDTEITGSQIQGNRITHLNIRNSITGANESIQINQDDLIINTAPIDVFFNSSLVWRGVRKVFMVLDIPSAMPTYSTTFPNNYPWTRVIEYPKHSGVQTTGKTLISFALPYGASSAELDKHLPVMEQFVKNEVKANIIKTVSIEEDRIYPLSSGKNLDNLNGLIEKAAELNNFFTLGRLGIFAYVSMSRAVEMAFELMNNMESLTDKQAKVNFYNSLRSQLW